MNCPYCGAYNREQTQFCISCGRDLTRPVANVRAQHPQTQPQPSQRTGQQTSRGATPVPPRPANQPVYSAAAPVMTGRQRLGQSAPPRAPEPEPVVDPGAPGPFPPRTMKQFTDLLTPGAQPYTLIESQVVVGNKQIVRISYKRCASWQQAATLLKALKEHAEEKYETTIIQGMLDKQPDIYAFTNGQLQLNRHVPLGGQFNDRYIVDTDDGFESASVRFVLNV